MSRRSLFTSTAGIRYDWEDDGKGGGLIHSTRDVDDVLDHNKALATHNDGYSPSREMRRVASIPLDLIQKWRLEEGWNAFDAGHDPDCARKLALKLNSSEYAYLRTAPGRVGVSNGVIR